MNNDFLNRRIRRVRRRYQWLGLWRKFAACWAGAALVGLGLVWLQRATGWTSPVLMPLFAALAGGVATALAILHYEKPPDDRWIARKIEARHPELDGLLLTAVQQQGSVEGDLNYFQTRVLQEATARSQEQDWRRIFPRSRLAAMHAIHLLAFACFAFTLSVLRVTPIHGETPHWTGTDGVTVTPGDASIERGDSLVVLARFGGTLPPAVSLLVRETGAVPRSIPLVRSLADPVFGGSVPEVGNDFTYHLEYRGRRTRDFKVSVFEHPRLVRADADLTFPGYTKLPPKHIEDTRRVSAVEGTRLDFALQLNKPVTSARLIARDGKKTAIPLTVSPDKAVATLSGFIPQKSQSYDLQLVDANGRANKTASPFVIDVQLNRPPELRLTSPRGDLRPSALEEVTFDGTVWDDFGSLAYGLAYFVPGSEPKFVEFGRDAAAKEKRTFSHVLRLEELGAKADDLISWYTWSDDIGPDGTRRRSSGDLFFAEVRPFEEIFRENQEMQSSEDQPSSGQGDQARRLTELQKQIISATWKLQRDGLTPKYADDAKVVRESQEQALAQAAEAQGEAGSPRQQAGWETAIKEMEKALAKLKAAAKDPAELVHALPPEQAAYQALLKLQPHESSVTRGGRGQGGGQQASQRQIDQLDLKQAENRYETQRQARAPQNKERTEQLAVMNRLQELARRQQDINERLKELQTSLQEARTEQEREEIQRRLKRLQEEQQQMLADVDDVRQRMDRQENQSRMAEERKQIEQTREDVQRAAQAAADGSVPQALAAGTRAQRQLQQMRDDMRRENSSQFAEDLREMRVEARDLAQRQEKVDEKLEALTKGAQQRRTLSETDDRKETIDQLTEQKERMNKLVERATQISEQAENTEPLLSRQLYDSIRKLSQDDANSVKQARQELLNSGVMTRSLYERLQRASEREGGGKALDLTSEMLREGHLPQARQAGQRARGEIDELRRGVERAAESVLGDESEQLKLAQSELDSLTDQLLREIAQAEGKEGGRAAGSTQAGAEPGSPESRDGVRRQAGMPGGERSPSVESGEAAGNERGAGKSSQEEGRQPAQRPGRDGRVAGADPQGNGRGQEGRQAGNEQSPGADGAQARGETNSQGKSGGQAGAAEGGVRGDTPGGQGQVARGGSQQGGRRGGSMLNDILNNGVWEDRNARAGWNGSEWNTGRWTGGPILGNDFGPWTDRLRDVEELIDTPELRSALAAARERARQLRRDVRQDQKKPDWAVVKLQVVKPLVEVRNRVAEELARRDSKESLAPIDRDPVPNRFAESVRRYYEELGKDKPEAR